MNSKPTSVQLIVVTGSRTGRKATIQLGFYMIGRHEECQIRPKSRSVSRRHCLLHWDSQRFRVFDLDSTSGTTVDNKKIPPRHWVELHEGNVLRCGKMGFEVAVGEEGVASSDSDTMISGGAWQEEDIAAFLEAHDSEDRDQRYQAIRETNRVSQESEDLEAASTLFSDVDEDEEPNDQPPGSPVPPKFPKKKSVPQARDWRALQLVGVAILTIATIGFAFYKAYQFASGPPARVVDGID